MAIPILPILGFLKNNWKLILTAVLIAATMKLSSDYGYNKSTVYHENIINELKEIESERVREFNRNLLFQLNLNSSLSKEKEQFEKSLRDKDKRHKQELEKLRNEKTNSDWLHTPIPPDVIDFLQNSGSQN